MTQVPTQDEQMRAHRLTQVSQQMAAIIEMLPRLRQADARAFKPLPGQFGPRRHIGDAEVALRNLKHLREEQVRHCRYLGLAVPPSPRELEKADA